MKKIIVSCLLSVVSCLCLAQIALPRVTKFHSPNSVSAKAPLAPLAVNSFYMDYDYADSAFWGPLSYNRQMWMMNDGYTPSDSAFKNFTVAFDSIFDPYALIAYPNNNIYTIKIDSIFLRLGHENNSGGGNSIAVKIVELTAAGYPTSNVLWATMLNTNTGLSPGNNWQNDTVISFAPMFTDSIQRFGVKVEYFGDTLDTLGFVAGYPTFASACGTSARRSNFYPNSFAYFTALGLQIPTAAGTTIFYECDGMPGYNLGGDGENYIQDINLWCYVEISASSVGIAEATASSLVSLNNYPNPFSSATRIEYELAEKADVKFEVTDLRGASVFERNEGVRDSGKHFIEFDAANLQSGIYFYSLKANGEKLTRKMAVLK